MELEPLLLELASIDRMLWVIGGSGAVTENLATEIEEPTFDDGYCTVEAEGWHLHLKLDSVAGVQFVEAEDHGKVPNLYYVRFSDAEEETLVRVYFPNPYLDDNENATDFQPEKLKAFEDIRDRYVGKERIVFAKRPKQASG